MELKEMSAEAKQARRIYKQNRRKKVVEQESPEERERRLAKNREYQRRYWERRAMREQVQVDCAMQIAGYIEKGGESDMKMTISRKIIDGLLDLVSDMSSNYENEDELRELTEDLREKLYRENDIELEIDTMA